MRRQLFDSDYFPASSSSLLKEGRYNIHRKLADGVSSSVWLVADSSEHSLYPFVAIKILTVSATQCYVTGQRQELDILKRIDDAEVKISTHIPDLYDHFIEQGPGGAHLCLVFDLFATSVDALRLSAPRKALPTYIIRNVISMLLDALSELRELHIVHTNVKLKNLLIKNWLTSGDGTIAEHLQEHPIEYEGEYVLENGDRYLAPKAQPILSALSWDTKPFDAELMTICLVDFGRAQVVGEQHTEHCLQDGDLALRAPESILKSDFDTGIDVWAVGCLAFELLVGESLFRPEANEKWTSEEDLLAKMMQVTGQKFPEPMLNRARRCDEFFDDKGNLLRVPHLSSMVLEDMISTHQIGIPDDEVKKAADFIRVCLRFEHTERPDPGKLEVHPFLKNPHCCG